ncbi:MAG: alpha/beta fold hydrolase [Tepidisphaeraceae bacterium]
MPEPPGAERFELQTADEVGATISTVVLRAPATSESAGTIILCHGFGLSKEWLYNERWMCERLGWNLVMFDFREHGDSSRHLGHPTLGHHEKWDVRAVVDHAERTGLPRPFVVIGASMGASVGLLAAAEDPRIDAVLAFSPYCNGLRGATQFLRSALGWLGDHVLKRFGQFHDMLRSVDLPAALAQRNDLPITLVVGERDCFPIVDARAILAGSASPESMKQLFVIPQGRHNQLWEWIGDAETPSYMTILRSFLDRHARRASERPPIAMGGLGNDQTKSIA